MTRAARLVGAVALLSTAGCRQSPSPDPVQPAVAIPAAAAKTKIATTDGAIAASNFLALYELSEKTAREQPDKPPVQRVSLLLAHAQYFGALDDYGRALAAAERLVGKWPRVPDAWLMRASARQSLHLFAGALTDLTRASELGADRDGVDAARAGILQALGRYEEALAIRQRLADKRATTASLAALAQLAGDMGQTERAETLFDKAQDAFADVSPFPLAWLWFQNGLVEERAGRPAAARELYQAAHQRLPSYAAATGHLAAALAAAGERGRAIALLEPLAASADDPEYPAELAVLLRAAGDGARADALTARAKRRYETLVQRFPAAFADHAARFYLGAGGDAARAKKLAASNLAARRTRDSYQLAIDAALAADDPAAACRYAREAASLPYPSTALELARSQAFARCHQAERAAAALAAAGGR